jgi:glutathione peroxidase-family protein
MAKADVNGPHTCAAYRALKAATQVPDIPWNFGRYFLVLKSGAVRTFGAACDPSAAWGCEQVPPSHFEDEINRALAGLEGEL